MTLRDRIEVIRDRMLDCAAERRRASSRKREDIRALLAADVDGAVADELTDWAFDLTLELERDEFEARRPARVA